MEIFIQSEIGGRSENQDTYGLRQTRYGKLIVVCDGMGGHRGGARASKLAVITILEEMKKASIKHDAVSVLRSAIEKANTRIWDESRSNSAYQNMGTTIVALLIASQKAICCHIGDSRLYQLRAGKIIHRTLDHSHVFELVKAGMMTEEEARVSNQSNIITRALGISPIVEIEMDNLSYQQGDRFLLCTDGIWGALPEMELIKLASRSGNIEQINKELVEKIDAIGFKNGGKHDNLTAALVDIDQDFEKNNKIKFDKKNKSIFRIAVKPFRKK